MNKLIATILVTASAAPALAHEGHAELPGAAGHDMAHVLLALVLGAVAWAGYRAWKVRKEE